MRFSDHELTISKLVRRRFEKNYAAFEAADKRNVVGKVVILHFITFVIPLSFFMALVNYAFEEEFTRFNIYFGLFHSILILCLMVVYLLFFDKMIIFALKLLDRVNTFFGKSWRNDLK